MKKLLIVIVILLSILSISNILLHIKQSQITSCDMMQSYVKDKKSGSYILVELCVYPKG